MSQVVTVTGATGNIGRVLVPALLQKGAKVRAVARNAGGLAPLAAQGAETHAGSVDDSAFMTRVLRGSDVAFLMIPPSYGEPDFRAYQRRVGESLARAVESSGVTRVVSLSSVGAERADGTGPIAGLRDFEQRLEAIPGVHVLHLRPTYFHENELNSIGLIRAAGITGSPLRADVPFSRVATRDIAAVAAEILAAPTFTGHSFRELLGPRDYTPREAARVLGTAIGRPDLPYVEFSYEDTRKALLQAGLSSDVASKFLEMYEGLNEGRIRPIQGRSASTSTSTTLEDFARETFAPAFRAGAQ